jgi:hypothetical protein
LRPSLAALHTRWQQAIVSPGSLYKWLSTWSIFAGREKVFFVLLVLYKKRCIESSRRSGERALDLEMIRLKNILGVTLR